jgi:hypothetical protein
VDGVAPDLLRDFMDLGKIWRFFRCVRQIVILLRSNSGFAQPLDSVLPFLYIRRLSLRVAALLCRRPPESAPVKR